MPVVGGTRVEIAEKVGLAQMQLSRLLRHSLQFLTHGLQQVLPSGKATVGLGAASTASNMPRTQRVHVHVGGVAVSPAVSAIGDDGRLRGPRWLWCRVAMR
jgi:hypothetical protein